MAGSDLRLERALPDGEKYHITPAVDHGSRRCQQVRVTLVPSKVGHGADDNLPWTDPKFDPYLVAFVPLRGDRFELDAMDEHLGDHPEGRRHRTEHPLGYRQMCV